MAVVGIDYTPAHEQGGGIGRLVRQQIAFLPTSDLTTTYRLFVAGAKRSDVSPTLNSHLHIRATRLTPRTLARVWHRAHIPLPVETFVGQIDLYHATDFVLPPTLPRTRTIVTVHDLSFVFTPETTSPRLRHYLSRVVPRSVKRADHIIADSQSTKKDLIELYRLPSDKISVVLSGVSEHFRPVKDKAKHLAMQQRYHLPDRPYFLSVGTVQPRKNYARIIRSLAVLRQAGYDVALVIAGGKGWLEDEMYATISSTRMTDYVHLIGYADDDDLPALYSAAVCTVFPSLYEGFGFPVLESMACATPVITSNLSSLPEIAGDAALMVDPYDQDGLTHAMELMLKHTNLRQELIERGQQQAKKFTWQASGQSLYETYRRVLNT